LSSRRCLFAAAEKKSLEIRADHFQIHLPFVLDGDTYALIQTTRKILVSQVSKSAGHRGGIKMPTPSSSDPRERIRAVVPKLIDLADKVVFGDVWERPGLSKRDRSLITVAALVALYRPEQLRGHIGRALTNGVTKDEISELITHLAFYSGWPTAVSAADIAKTVFDEQK
jgi:4-carboxymuconolactone decarboxylase